MGIETERTKALESLNEVYIGHGFNYISRRKATSGSIADLYVFHYEKEQDRWIWTGFNSPRHLK